MARENRLSYLATQKVMAVTDGAKLTAIMHHASLFCTLGWRTHAVGPSVWIGERELAMQSVWG